MSRVPSALYDESIMHDLKDTLGLQDRTVVVLVRASQIAVFFFDTDSTLQVFRRRHVSARSCSAIWSNATREVIAFFGDGGIG